MEKLKFTVKRSEWLSGDILDDGDFGTLCRYEDGKKCCLGFYCEQLGGVLPEHLVGHDMPHDLGLFEVDEATDGWQPAAFDTSEPSMTAEQLAAMRLLYENENTAGEIARCNDNDELNPASREALLKELFARIGVEVEFVD